MEKLKPKVEMGPIFRKVLRCFDTNAEFARQIGVKDRRNVREWKHRLGYIPLKYAVLASVATEGKVTAAEIITETARMMERRAVERATIERIHAQLQAEAQASEGGE